MNEHLGYFDLQVNGYAGVDFNGDRLTGDRLDAACRAMRADGVGRFLITIITDELDSMSARHGLGWWQIDASYWVIRGLELIGLAWNVKLPSPTAIARETRL